MSKRRRHQQRSNSGVYKSDTRNQVYKSGESFSLPGSPDKEEIEYIASLPMDKLQQKLKAIVKENSTNRSDDGKENMTIDLFELHRPPQAGKKFALLKNRRGIPSAHGSGEVGKFSLSNPEEDEIRKVIMDRWEKRVVENEKYKDQNTELGRLLNTDSDDDVEPMEVDGGMNVNMRSVNRHGSYDLTPNERQYGLPFSGYPDQLDADLKECGYDVHFECEKAESIEQRRVLPPRDRRIVHRTGVNKYMHTNTYSRADDQVLNHEDSRTMEIDMLAMKRSKYHRLRDRRLREKEAKKQMELEEKERMEQYGTSFEDIDTIVNKIEPSEQKVNVSKKKKKRNKNDKNAKEIEASFGDTLDFIEPAHGYKPLVSCNSSDNDTVVPEEKSGKNKSKKKLKKTRSVDNEFRSGSSVSGASLPEKVSVSTKKKKEEKLSTVRKEVHKTTSDEKSVAKSTSVLQNSTKESDEKGKGKNKKKIKKFISADDTNIPVHEKKSATTSPKRRSSAENVKADEQRPNSAISGMISKKQPKTCRKTKEGQEVKPNAIEVPKVNDTEPKVVENTETPEKNRQEKHVSDEDGHEWTRVEEKKRKKKQVRSHSLEREQETKPQKPTASAESGDLSVNKFERKFKKEEVPKYRKNQSTVATRTTNRINRYSGDTASICSNGSLKISNSTQTAINNSMRRGSHSELLNTPPNKNSSRGANRQNKPTAAATTGSCEIYSTKPSYNHFKQSVDGEKVKSSNVVRKNEEADPSGVSVLRKQISCSEVSIREKTVEVKVKTQNFYRSDIGRSSLRNFGQHAVKAASVWYDGDRKGNTHVRPKSNRLVKRTENRASPAPRLVKSISTEFPPLASPETEPRNCTWVKRRLSGDSAKVNTTEPYVNVTAGKEEMIMEAMLSKSPVHKAADAPVSKQDIITSADVEKSLCNIDKEVVVEAEETTSVNVEVEVLPQDSKDENAQVRDSRGVREVFSADEACTSKQKEDQNQRYTRQRVHSADRVPIIPRYSSRSDRYDKRPRYNYRDNYYRGISRNRGKTYRGTDDSRHRYKISPDRYYNSYYQKHDDYHHNQSYSNQRYDQQPRVYQHQYSNPETTPAPVQHMNQYQQQQPIPNPVLIQPVMNPVILNNVAYQRPTYVQHQVTIPNQHIGASESMPNMPQFVQTAPQQVFHTHAPQAFIQAPNVNVPYAYPQSHYAQNAHFQQQNFMPFLRSQHQAMQHNPQQIYYPQFPHAGMDAYRNYGYTYRPQTPIYTYLVSNNNNANYSDAYYGQGAAPSHGFSQQQQQQESQQYRPTSRSHAPSESRSYNGDDRRYTDDGDVDNDTPQERNEHKRAFSHNVGHYNGRYNVDQDRPYTRDETYAFSGDEDDNEGALLDSAVNGKSCNPDVEKFYDTCDRVREREPGFLTKDRVFAANNAPSDESEVEQDEEVPRLHKGKSV